LAFEQVSLFFLVFFELAYKAFEVVGGSSRGVCNVFSQNVYQPATLVTRVCLELIVLKGVLQGSYLFISVAKVTIQSEVVCPLGQVLKLGQRYEVSHFGT
jgi:hypothetical protein